MPSRTSTSRRSHISNIPPVRIGEDEQIDYDSFNGLKANVLFKKVKQKLPQKLWHTTMQNIAYCAKNGQREYVLNWNGCYVNINQKNFIKKLQKNLFMINLKKATPEQLQNGFYDKLEIKW